MKNAILTAFITAFLAFAGLAGAQTNLTVSANIHSILQASNYAAVRGLLDLEPGTDFLTPSAIAAAYQPLDGQLTNIGGLADPNADRILFWDDSTGLYAYLTVGSGLSISGTTITATGGAFDSAGNYTLTGDWDFTGGTVALGALTATSLTTPNALLSEAAAPSTPASGKVILYAKTDGLLYSKDDAGAETALSTSVTASSTTTFTNKTLTSPVYTETTISASAIDWAAATTFTKTLSANTTFTFSNLVNGKTINVALTNTASNYTVTWPTVSWSGGSAPVQTVGAKTDIYTFIRIGGTVYGSVVQNF